MLKVKNLSKNYSQKPAIRNLSFEAKAGDIIGLLGSNGSGKSTTLKILAGIENHDSGEVLLNEKKIFKEDLGYVPETSALYGDLTVKEYLLFMASLRGVGDIREVLKLFELKDVENKLCFTLSKGYQQRVMLAQALLHNPRLLLLDEPNTGLDPLQLKTLEKILKSISKNMIIILSSHQLIEVKNLCTKIIGLRNGEKIFDATESSDIDEIYTQLSA